MRTRSLSGGFTLIEVLVALAIVSLTLISALQAGATLMRNANRQADLLLAQICASNAANAMRLQRGLPSLGKTELECEMANRKLQVEIRVNRTPNPNFRLMQTAVFLDGNRILNLSSIQGINFQ